jgi:bla regulator protein blaR1
MTLSRLAAGAVLVVSATALSVSRPHAQAPAQAPDPNAALTYEAASVKPNKSGVQGSSIRRFPGGRLQATNMPLRALITFAYQVQGFQLVDDPTWIRNENFDIVAKMEGDPPPVMPGTGPDPHMVAMRTLLAERFKLAVRRETREMDIYALVLARPDGKLGPALKPTTQDCAAMIAAARGGPPPGPPPGPNSPVVCGMRGLPGRLVAGAMPMSLLASNLSGQVQRIVVDRTGLSGAWDFEITFAPERPLNPPPGVEFPPADPNAPSLFTAMQEQLGLKLQSVKGPVEVLVVERVEPPISD